MRWRMRRSSSGLESQEGLKRRQLLSKLQVFAIFFPLESQEGLKQYAVSEVADAHVVAVARISRRVETRTPRAPA